MNKRLYFFETDKGQFVFDGDNVSLSYYKGDMDFKIQHNSVLPLLDSHR